MRDQLNALKALIDAKPPMDDVSAAIVANSAGNVSGVDTLSVFASNPPTQSEVQQIINYLNDLLDTMKR